MIRKIKNTALLIIDMQNDFVLEDSSQCIKGTKKIIPNIKEILNIFRKNNDAVFHVYREYRENGSDIESTRLEDFLTNQKYCVPNTSGCEIIDEIIPIKNEYKIIKNRFSGFMNTELDFILRRLKITNIVVCGIQYPNCIRATIYDGISLDYSVTLITDATGAKTEEIKNANIYDIRNIGVNCITTSQYIEER